MAKAAKRHNKSKEELVGEMKMKEVEERKRKFVEVVEAAEKEYGVKIGVELVYAKAGIVPRVILTDNPQPVEDVKESE